MTTSCTSPLKVTNHFDGSRFYNLEPVQNRGLWDVIKWRFTSKRAEWPENQSIPFGPKPRERQPENTLNYIVVNHATVLVQIGAVNVLFDPIWSERSSPISWAGPKRAVNPGLKFADLPPIDLVLISHNHYDHMDLPTLKRLEEQFQPVFVTSLGNRALLQENGCTEVYELDWWERKEFKNLVINFVPAQHFSSRTPFDHNKTLWGGFVVQDAKSNSVYFAGDTGYAKFFKSIGEKFGPLKLAFLPIGAFSPRWFMQPVHMNPSDAIQAHADINSNYSVAIHFGTFQLADDGWQEPVEELRKELASKSINGVFEIPTFGEQRGVEL